MQKANIGENLAKQALNACKLRLQRMQNAFHLGGARRPLNPPRACGGRRCNGKNSEVMKELAGISNKFIFFIIFPIPKPAFALGGLSFYFPYKYSIYLLNLCA
jgi:hypothetical protein